MKAVWNDTVIAESDDTVVVEGNHYFPSSSIKMNISIKPKQVLLVLGKVWQVTILLQSMEKQTQTVLGIILYQVKKQKKSKIELPFGMAFK